MREGDLYGERGRAALFKRYQICKVSSATLSVDTGMQCLGDSTMVVGLSATSIGHFVLSLSRQRYNQTNPIGRNTIYRLKSVWYWYGYGNQTSFFNLFSAKLCVELSTGDKRHDTLSQKQTTDNC